MLCSITGLGGVWLLSTDRGRSSSLPPPGTQVLQVQAPVADWTEFDPVGRWVIAEGEAGYRVGEELARMPVPSNAVGKTTGVAGEFTLLEHDEGHVVSNIRVEVDMTRLVSDNARRDQALRTRGLETDRFPTATFFSQYPLAIPENLDPGAMVEFPVEGALTIHGVTRQVLIPVQAQLRHGRLEVSGSLMLPMASFGIVPPNVANLVSVASIGTMEFRLVLDKAD